MQMTKFCDYPYDDSTYGYIKILRLDDGDKDRGRDRFKNLQLKFNNFKL